MSYRIGQAANARIDDIYRSTFDRWGEAQAEQYIRALFVRFEAIADRTVPWRPIPSEFGVDGFYCRYECHFVYWRILSDGSVGIVTILHERIHQLDRFREDHS